MNGTLVKFGYPASLIKDYDHWCVLLRPQQVTLGSLVLAAKSEATAFGALPAGAHAELAIVTADIERHLQRTLHYDKINYLMLMMVDPHVHMHVLPRYRKPAAFDGHEFADAGWPGPADLKSIAEMPEVARRSLLWTLQQRFSGEQ
jgi:diadenosine tetraphosphate (Ap4A) HIT family hydrolase